MYSGKHNGIKQQYQLIIKKEMKMKKILFVLSLAVAVALSFSSCSDDNDDNGKTTPEYQEGIIGYTAGAGNYGQNQGTVGSIMNNSLGEFIYSGDLYEKANGKGIGDAQDVLAINGLVYVTCTTSSKIEILDANGKIVKTITMPNKSPRYLATDGKYAYASAYSGYVYKLDKNGIVDSVAVGPYPEAMSVADNGKLYVNLSNYTSDGNGKYIAVVDLGTFHKVKCYRRKERLLRQLLRLQPQRCRSEAKHQYRKSGQPVRGTNDCIQSKKQFPHCHDYWI